MATSVLEECREVANDIGEIKQWLYACRSELHLYVNILQCGFHFSRQKEKSPTMQSYDILQPILATRASGCPDWSAKQKPAEGSLCILTLSHMAYDLYALWISIKAMRYGNSKANFRKYTFPLFCVNTSLLCGPGSSVGIATELRAGRHSDWATGWTVRDRILAGTRFSVRPDRSWGPPSLLYNGYRVFPEGRGGRGVRLTSPTPSSAEDPRKEQSYTSTHT